MKHWKWNEQHQEWRSNQVNVAALSANVLQVGGWHLDSEATDELLTLLQRRKDGRLAPEPTFEQLQKWLKANWYGAASMPGATYYGPTAASHLRIVLTASQSAVPATLAAINHIMGRDVTAEVLAQ